MATNINTIPVYRAFKVRNAFGDEFVISHKFTIYIRRFCEKYNCKVLSFVAKSKDRKYIRSISTEIAPL